MIGFELLVIPSSRSELARGQGSAVLRTNMANSRMMMTNCEDNIFSSAGMGAAARHFRLLLFTTKSTFAAIVSRVIVPKDRPRDGARIVTAAAGACGQRECVRITGLKV